MLDSIVRSRTSGSSLLRRNPALRILCRTHSTAIVGIPCGRRWVQTSARRRPPGSRRTRVVVGWGQCRQQWVRLTLWLDTLDNKGAQRPDEDKSLRHTHDNHADDSPSLRDSTSAAVSSRRQSFGYASHSVPTSRDRAACPYRILHSNGCLVSTQR